MNDAAAATLIFAAQANYRRAGLRTLAAAWLFGRHRRVRHLGYEARVAFWRGTPYLLTFREVE